MKINEQGLLTLDFIFALVLMSSVTVILLSLSLTLAVVETAQYTAFSASRVYFAGHKDVASQQALAEAKFASLMQRPEYRSLFSGSWFSLTLAPKFDFQDEYPEQGPTRMRYFYGARVLLSAPILAKSFPFLGSTGEDSSFKSNVNSFLGREPTDEECLDVIRQRWEKLQAIIPVTGIPNLDRGAYVAIADNGC